MLCGFVFDSALGVLGFVEVSSFVVMVLLDFHFTLWFFWVLLQGCYTRFSFIWKKRIWVISFLGKKRCGFFFLFGRMNAI